MTQNESRKTSSLYNFLFLLATAYFPSLESTDDDPKERKKSNFCYFRSTRSFLSLPSPLFILFLPSPATHIGHRSIVVFIDAHKTIEITTEENNWIRFTLIGYKGMGSLETVDIVMKNYFLSVPSCYHINLLCVTKKLIKSFSTF